MIVYFSWICFSEDLGCTEYHEDYMIVYSHWVGRERERERDRESKNNKHGMFF
jgi:hypothetical protein